jgi:hypothetical protein
MSFVLPRYFHIPLPRECNFTDERIGIVRLISFLNDIERIATRNYEPSDDDVIRARLRTLGVQEYSFWVEQGTLAVHSCRPNVSN